MTGFASATSPTNHSTDRARVKALLGSARTLPKLNPAGSLPELHTPALTPSVSAPHAQPSSAVEFVANLDQIRVDTMTSVRDGATLYVVETYTLYQFPSHISALRSSSTVPLPTTTQTQIRQPVLSLGSRTSTATPTTASTSEHHEDHDAPERAPDLCVHRRFADFARLRHEAMAAACVNAHFLCQYCRQFQAYARFHAAQPFWIVRVVTTKTQRKKILARFLSDLADFAQSRAQRHRHCRLRQTLPKLIETFLSG
ncbi:uncharacterized protein IUM83_05717 [Phytophthora cinnamomi]|uniref:uncharacterized protein n=1 Tax=Phytophthora cinnamomi TaxID=4785 RepID=UPI00355953C1|nr:hypothetical protein IUM83_05717 [Phytophthora cinnamomi]